MQKIVKVQIIFICMTYLNVLQPNKDVYTCMLTHHVPKMHPKFCS